MIWRGIIQGELASKSNQRRLILIGDKPRNIKSKKAIDWEKAALMQIRPPAAPLTGDIEMTALIVYASRRPDLDDTLLCDVLEKAGVIGNDRQIKEKHLIWGLSKDNPRVEIRLKEIEHELYGCLNDTLVRISTGAGSKDR